MKQLLPSGVKHQCVLEGEDIELDGQVVAETYFTSNGEGDIGGAETSMHFAYMDEGIQVCEYVKSVLADTRSALRNDSNLPPHDNPDNWSALQWHSVFKHANGNLKPPPWELTLMHEVFDDGAAMTTFSALCSV
jgi:hypothetical protein